MEEVELRLFLRLLFENKRVIIWSVVISVFLCTVITLLAIKREYTATSTLLYSQSSMASAAGSIAGSLGLSVGVSSTGPAEWFELILTSRQLARKMVKKYRLVPVLKAKDEFQAVGALIERIIITPKPEANAVQVAVKIPGSPIKCPVVFPIDKARAQMAADITNDLVSELSRWMKTNDYQNSTKERKFIQGELQTQLAQINVTRLQLVDTFKRTGVFAPDDQGKAYLDAMTTLQQDIATTTAQLKGTRILQQAGLSPDEVARLAAAAETEAKTSDFTGDLMKQMTALEVQLRQETEVNHKTESHPDVIALRQSIAELKGKLGRGVKIVNSARGLEEKGLASTLNLGQARWSVLMDLIKKLPARGLDVEELKRKLQAQGDMVEMLEKQLLLAEITEQQQAANFNILDPAEAPHQQTSPSMILGAAVGFALGVIIGMMLIGIKYFRGTLARSKPELEAAA